MAEKNHCDWKIWQSELKYGYFVQDCLEMIELQTTATGQLVPESAHTLVTLYLFLVNSYRLSGQLVPRNSTRT